MMHKCRVNDCGKKTNTLRTLKRHYREEHSGDVWTPKEHLPDTQSEQRDFAGDEPDTSDHDPESLVEPREKPDTRLTSLFEHERENDQALPDCTDGENDGE